MGLSFTWHFFVGAFFLRVLAGVILTLVYTYYYPDRSLADTFRYFDDSYFLHELFKEDPKEYCLVMLGMQSDTRDAVPILESMTNWFPALRSPLYNDNRTVIRMNALMRWFSFGSYYVHMCCFAFLGFVGQMFLFRAFQQYFKGKEIGLALALFMVPSLVFWTSGVLKEGPLFFCFGVLLYLMEKVGRCGLSRRNLFIISALSLFLFHLKFYVGLMVLPVFTLKYIFSKKRDTSRWRLVIWNYSFYFGLATVWHFMRHKWSLFTVFRWKKEDFQGLAESMNAGSLISTYDLEDNGLSFLINVPQGLFNSLFRPFLWEVYSPVILVSALENIFLLTAVLFCVAFRGKLKWTDENWCFLVYAVSLLTVVGMVTPIMGSLVRYKIPALPFLLMFFISIVDMDKLKEFTTKFKKQ